MRKIVTVLVVAIALSQTMGCGESDPNANLKPVGKDAPKPTQAGTSSGPVQKAPKVVD